LCSNSRFEPTNVNKEMPTSQKKPSVHTPLILKTSTGHARTSKFPAEKQHETQICLDQADIDILSVLQKNCQLSNRKLGSALGVSGTIIANRIKNLEEKGILKGYAAILDPVKLGYDLTAIIFVQTEGGYLGEIEMELERIANVIGVYEVTGDFDIIAVAKLKDRESLNTLIKNLLLTPHVRRTLTNITLNIVKEDFKVPF
jgi:Lrp/AsnC family transcriptional regulator for asnA, asnC and gidA